MGLFEPDLPAGFLYRADFLGAGDERDLATAITEVSFDSFAMRGVVARRRVKFYGQAYDDRPSLPMPEFLLPLRASLARWAGVATEAFVMALINEYPRGATIGWHRDAPQYGITAGVSLLSSCRMKLRPYVSPNDLAGPAPRAPRKSTHEIELAPRSGYLITGLARDGYEHSIPATAALRYSITFRTLR
ncbi:MAG TPA: alpha-ketoglutarate-dependent dioxygenase AlkB [Vicinamibacterales bacterium]|nr:alpha-ketoglutarate-dependent dioxygenase AlkB [Vicinamibacterales bacterium]